MIAPPRAVSGAPVGGWVGRGGGEKGVGGTEEELRGCGKRQEEPRGNKGRPSFIHQLTHTSPPASPYLPTSPNDGCSARPPGTTIHANPRASKGQAKEESNMCVCAWYVSFLFSRGGDCC